VIDMLVWYLWDNKDIQNTFIDEFLKNCNEHLANKEKQKAIELIELVVHDLFLEHTC
jgi:hypothetical protein